MSGTLFSASWHRVAALKPQVHRHAIFHRHDYRGQVWYVVEDRTAERFHRFAPATYFLIGLMDGARSVEAIWRAAIEKLGDAAPSQDDVIRLLAQLHAADLIKTHTTAEADDLFRRYQAIDRQSWLKWLSAPFALRTPLLDPDRPLARLAPLFRPVFTPLGFIAWLAVVGAGAVVAASHWPALAGDFADRLLAPWNLAAIALAYVGLKLFHELGHALAVKVWGGRVPEVGLMFIVFMPVPYVDASAASAFPSKWRRLVVDGAGIMVEMLFAALALFLWVDAEPGPWRSFLYNVMVIGTVSTLLFNGNPLLRFDGYYLFADVLEIPNLGQRAQAYMGYLFDRYMLGLRRRESPVSAPGEAFWFLLYAPVAGAYRLFLALSIALVLASEYAVVGAVLAAWAVLLMVVMPLVNTGRKLSASIEAGGSRARAAAATAALAAGALALVFLLPVPHATLGKGIAVVPEKASVRAGAEGFVTEVVARPDAPVSAGAPLLRLADPIVDAEVRALKARLASLQAKLDALDLGLASPVEAAVVREEMKSVREALEQEKLRKAEQTVLAPTDGVFVFPRAADSPGRFVQRGETVGFVQDPHRLTVSVVLDQVSYGEIQNRLDAVALWPEGTETTPVPARITLMHPGGVTTLPSEALAVEGGGDIPVDPRRPGELRTLSAMFRIDVEPQEPPPPGSVLIGRHYAVKFRHAPEPVGWQLLRAGRRLLLDRFGV